MKRALLGGVFAVGALAGLVAGGCGGGGTGTGTGGTGGATVSSSATHGGPTATTGTGAGGNHSFDTAAAVDVGGSADGDLSPAGAVDYYTFEGQAGQAIAVYTYAQRSATGAGFDPTWIDTIVTLFDASKTQIAENNDEVPRNTQDSVLYTLLPADGTYYVRVEECWTWAQNPKSTCLGAAAKDNTAYTLGVNLLDPTKPGTVKDGEAAGNASTPVTFGKAPAGGYYLSEVYGTFTDASDTDVFSLTVPSDAVTVPAGSRGTLSFWVFQAGTSGDGSTTPAGKVYLTDPGAADPTAHLAEVSGTDFLAWARLWPAVDLTRPYLLHVEHPATAAGAHDFYFMLQGQGISNPVELDDAKNDSLATPEVPADAPDTSGGHHYYVDGDIVSAADVDHYKVPVSAGTTKVAVSCAAQRGGSGVRGFTIDILDATGATTIGTITETAAADAYTGFVTIPAAATSLVVRMSTKMPQDPGVAGKYYHCGIHLQP